MIYKNKEENQQYPTNKEILNLWSTAPIFKLTNVENNNWIVRYNNNLIGIIAYNLGAHFFIFKVKNKKILWSTNFSKEITTSINKEEFDKYIYKRFITSSLRCKIEKYFNLISFI